MKKEIRAVVFHDRLRLESCRFTGIEQPFPNHFHDHYVIGYIEGGRRSLTCRNRTRVIQKGDLILFNPGDSHACTQTGNDALTYRSLNVPQNVMQKLAEDVTGSHDLPGFSPNVITDEEAVYCLIPLHEMLMGGGCELGWEEKLLFLLSILIQKYSRPFQQCIPACRDEIEKVCAYMEQNYAGHITLDQLCRCAGLSKSTLLFVPLQNPKGSRRTAIWKTYESAGQNSFWNRVSPLSRRRFRPVFPTRAILPTISPVLSDCRPAVTAGCLPWKRRKGKAVMPRKRRRAKPHRTAETTGLLLRLPVPLGTTVWRAVCPCWAVKLNL